MAKKPDPSDTPQNAEELIQALERGEVPNKNALGRELSETLDAWLDKLEDPDDKWKERNEASLRAFEEGQDGK